MCNCGCSSDIGKCGGSCGGEVTIITEKGEQGIQGIQGPDGLGYDAVTSSSALVVATGSVAFTITIDKAFNPGARVRVSRTAAPTTTWMEGIVLSYTVGTGAITVNFDKVLGSGVYSDWDINIIGEPGAVGASGSNGTNGTNGIDGFGYDATSSTSITLPVTATPEALTITVDKAYVVGSRVRIANTGDPENEFFEGIVTVFTSATGAMTVAPDVPVQSGSGTINTWGISIAGEPGIVVQPVRKTFTSSSIITNVIRSSGPFVDDLSILFDDLDPVMGKDISKMRINTQVLYDPQTGTDQFVYVMIQRNNGTSTTLKKYKHEYIPPAMISTGSVWLTADFIFEHQDGDVYDISVGLQYTGTGFTTPSTCQVEFSEIVA